jgi:hypothetical protein
MQPSTPDANLSLLMIEAGLMLVAILAAFALPRLQSKTWERIERLFSSLARRKTLACFFTGAALLLMRLALLPLFPPPLPFSTDDFSFLLAADTFLHGRLTNPTPPMWTHFESIHITMQPTYMTMYFPGPALVMAAGKAIFGHPWAGVLITGALMCAALVWMLQAWLPPRWALLGGLIAVLRIGLFSYWINSYAGGATLSVMGGALVLGSLPRLTRTGRFRYGMMMSVGIALLVLTRPYEGLLVCLPTAIALGAWLLFGKNRPPVRLLALRAAAPILLLAAVFAWLGYYNLCNFGSPKILPYTVARSTYAVVPYYVWQPAHVVRAWRHPEMARFYTESETKQFSKLSKPWGWVPFNQSKLLTSILFFAGVALLPPLLMSRRVLLDRRTRFFVCSLPVWVAGLGIGVFLIPHYLAAFSAGVYVLGLQAMRHLYVWKYKGDPVGRALVRYTIVICILLAGLRVYAKPLNLEPAQWPIGPWLATWIGPGHFGADRQAVEDQLERIPGSHLIFVRYSADHEPGDEWVYNGADIDGSRVIWAREMTPANDQELIRYYKDRDVYLVQPDLDKGRITPYASAPRTTPNLLAQSEWPLR